MDITKAFWKSKTFWGLIISVLGKIAALVFGADYLEGIDSEAVAGQIEAAFTNESPLAALISVVVSFVGDVFAAYGRVKAKTKIALTG